MNEFLNTKLKTKFSLKDDKLLFLLAINVVPLALVFLTSMIMGVKIRTMWMTPFYLFLGILVIYIFQSQINFKSFISIIPFFIVLLPHLIWLTENNYVTITYGLDRTGTGDQNFLDHIIHPLIFIVKQIGILMLFFLMFLFLISKLKSKFNFSDNKLLFLISINIIPIALVFLT